MFKYLFILLILAFSISCKVQSNEQFIKGIDRKKWRTSSDYRYDFVLRGNFHALVKNRSKNEVIKTLGAPSLQSDNLNELIYCLDTELTFQDEKTKKKICCKCKGSWIVIFFDKDEKVYTVMTGNVELLDFR